jgi:hypothetical protein
MFQAKPSVCPGRSWIVASEIFLLIEVIVAEGGRSFIVGQVLRSCWYRSVLQ